MRSAFFVLTILASSFGPGPARADDAPARVSAKIQVERASRFSQTGTLAFALRPHGGSADPMSTVVQPDGSVCLAAVIGPSVNVGGKSFHRGDGVPFLLAKFDPAGGHLWSRSIGREGVETHPWDLAPAVDGGLFAVSGERPIDGRDTSSIRYDAMRVQKYSKHGVPEWARTFDTDWPLRLAAGPKGSIYVAGAAEGRIRLDGRPVLRMRRPGSFLAKLSARGELDWIRAVTTSAEGYIWVNELAVGPSGRVYAVGVQQERAVLGSVLAFDAAGSRLWRVPLRSTGESGMYEVAVTADERVFVSGAGRGDTRLGRARLSLPPEKTPFVAALDSSGVVAWYHTVGAAPQDLQADVAGDMVYATNVEECLEDECQTDILLVERAADDGRVLHRWQYGDEGMDAATAIDVARDGLVLLGTFSTKIRFHSGPIRGPENTMFVAKLRLPLAGSSTSAGHPAACLDAECRGLP